MANDQLLRVAKDPASDALVGEITKEALHHIEPRGAGRREVHVDARVTRQPLLMHPGRCSVVETRNRRLKGVPRRWHVEAIDNDGRVFFTVFSEPEAKARPA
jgi:hypothetical protein